MRFTRRDGGAVDVDASVREGELDVAATEGRGRRMMVRLGPTLLNVMLVALAVAPASIRSDVVYLVGVHEAGTYEAFSAASPREMVRGVAGLIAEMFDVPPPPHVRLHVYPSQLTFAHGLVRDVGLAPRVALELASSAIGLALPRTVFLLADRGEDDRLRLVAHEMTHVVQLELSGARARPAQWAMEGTAEWAALTLLTRLGAVGIDERIDAARTAARRYLDAHPAFTPAVLRRSADFRRWQRRVGDLIAYQVAYALAEQLVARHGLPAVVAYFRAFRDCDNPAKNFARAFGASTAEFTTQARMALGVGGALARPQARHAAGGSSLHTSGPRSQ